MRLAEASVCSSRARLIVGSLMLALLASGCSGAEQEVAPSPPSLTSSADLPQGPSVDRPLDVAGFAQRPCELLTAAETDVLNLMPGGRSHVIVDVQACEWKSSDLDNLSIALEGERDLLSIAYRNQNGSLLVPTDISGYPSVREKAGGGRFNSCTVTTRLGPEQSLTTDWVGTSGVGDGDSCENAERASAMVIRKLPPAR